MTSDLRVPLASLPGFDPVGLCLRASAGAMSAFGPCVDRDEGEAGVFDLDHDGMPDVIWLPVAQAFLDLADASTRDRVARYVAGRVGLVVGSTAPWLTWHGPNNRHLWELASPSGEVDFGALPWPGRVAVIGLGGLDPTDDTRLPDGSRLVDAVALARVAAHVGGDA